MRIKEGRGEGRKKEKKRRWRGGGKEYI